MKKILKAITFLSLAMCLMLNTNFVYAFYGENYIRNENFMWGVGRHRVYDLYFTHDEVKKLASSANSDSLDFWALVKEAAQGCGEIIDSVKAVKGASKTAGSISQILSGIFLKRGDEWLITSATSGYRGIVVHLYRWEPKPGFFQGPITYGNCDPR